MSKKWTDKPTQIRKGEKPNIENLEPYLLEYLAGASGKLVIDQFPGGFSNLTYRLQMGEEQYVLRRPPYGAKIKSAHDMSREYRILSHLEKVYPKAPKPLLYCEDEAVLGAPFYVMERVNGVILRPKMPQDMIPDAVTMKGIAHSLVDTFAELHAVDYEAAGLGDLGRPEGYVERQVKGWTKRYFKAKTDEIPAMESVAKWLADNMPNEGKPSLIHNDFKYDNMVLAADDWTKVIAVLDWEMATLGDPLMDLGTSIGYWINANDPPFMLKMQLSPTVLPGNPTRGEIVQLYAEKSGRDMSNIVFYYVYGLFKIAVIVQQIYYRYKMGYTSDNRFAHLIDAVKGCGAVAHRAIEKKKIEDLF